ncbi:MAG: hypothetical protein ABIN01_16325 [Ferruginibacter sp.]
MSYLLGCSLLFFNAAFAQNDTLKKYSYLIIAKTNGKDMPFGTCFFVRTKNNLFLASADHVILRRDVNGNDYEFHPDSFYVRCCDNKNKKFCLGIDTKEYKENTPRVPKYMKTDIFLFKVKAPAGAKIHSIEKLIDYSEDYTKKPDSVIVYGYGDDSIEGSLEDNNSATAVPNLRVGTIVDEIKKGIYFSVYNAVDTTLYSTTSEIVTGYSGSPVFLKYLSAKKKPRIIFGGVGQGADLVYHKGYIVRPDIFLKILKAKDK